jgi:hypothetical protein
VLGADQVSPVDKPIASIPPLTRVTEARANGAVEVSVAINPTNPNHLIAASIARIRDVSHATNFTYVSRDGGHAWTTVPRANPQRRQQGDDVMTFTGDGLAVHTFIAFNGILTPRPRRASSGIHICTSRDGLTWTDAVPVVDHVNSVEPHEDKPGVKVDLSKDSPHHGNLYVAWTRFDVYGSKNPEHKSRVYFSRSVDAGKSFSVPLSISEVPGDALDGSNTVMGAVPAVGPNGDVNVIWAGPLGLVCTKSTDGGQTFGKNQVVTTTKGWDFPIKGLGRADGLPSAGVDISQGKDRGSLYVAWGDTRNGDADVFLTISRDGGATWGQPIRVNNDPQGNGKEQWFPGMVVDPVDGSINIAYYDRAAYDDTRTGVTLARSTDGGRSFAYYPLSPEPFDLNHPGFFGDYLGIDAYGGRVAVLFMQTLDGTKKLGISAAVRDFARSARSLPPYPPGPVIEGVSWDFEHLVRQAPGSDLWPMTWAADDSLYTTWGDGGGFGGTDRDGRASLGFARLDGPANRFQATNIWGGKNSRHPATFGGKVGALVAVGGVLYAVGGVWPSREGLRTWSCPREARLLWSIDGGATWQTSPWTFANAQDPAFGPVSFLNFGKDYAGARDAFVYVYFTTAWWEWTTKRRPPTNSYLARVPRSRIKERSAYEFFQGCDAAGRPSWTTELGRRQPVFSDPNGRRLSKVVYDRELKRYLATAAGAQVGQFGLFDAPEPWGPWTTVAYEDNWGGLGATEALEYDLPTKWIEDNGKTVWCVFSSTGRLDAFNLVRGTLRLRAESSKAEKSGAQE